MKSIRPYGIAWGDHANWQLAPATETGTPASTFLVANDTSGPQRARSWMDSIFPYIKSTQLFVCPSAVFDPVNSGGYGYSAALSGALTNVYANAAGGAGSNNGLSGAAIASVKRPSEIIMVMDANHQNLGLRLFEAQVVNAYNGSKPHQSVFMPHLEGGNVLYTDGHVKWAAIKNSIFQYGIAGPTGDWTAPAWNPFLG